ncbi:MAG: hypothetical protein QUV02_08500 [Maricaulis sp.]|uniref:hypothetical protein n=1 Tax=Maricaulis sp. TaxID=1486257 RepID=UPI002603FBC3|nr:hypothetical protein [Maricaulis sp.]MDM7984479.1 hypothetical protein [Maricaulis sp.]
MQVPSIVEHRPAPQVKTDRAFAKSRRAFSKTVLKEVRSRLKGTGWRLSGNTLFKQIDALFVCLRVQSFLNADHTSISIELKPMEVDSILWQALDMETNEGQPLSFRASAAFQCWASIVDTVEINDANQASQTAELIVQHAFTRAQSAASAVSGTPFSVWLEGLKDEGSDAALPHTALLVCAMIADGRVDEARAKVDQVLAQPSLHHGIVMKSGGSFTHYLESLKAMLSVRV